MRAPNQLIYPRLGFRCSSPENKEKNAIPIRAHPHFTIFIFPAEILEAHKRGKIASLIGVEGGHSLGSSLAVLRTLYQLGVRYLTLTHTCDTPWAKSSNVEENEEQGEKKH